MWCGHGRLVWYTVGTGVQRWCSLTLAVRAPSDEQGGVLGVGVCCVGDWFAGLWLRKAWAASVVVGFVVTGGEQPLRHKLPRSGTADGVPVAWSCVPRPAAAGWTSGWVCLASDRAKMKCVCLEPSSVCGGKWKAVGRLCVCACSRGAVCACVCAVTHARSGGSDDGRWTGEGSVCESCRSVWPPIQSQPAPLRCLHACLHCPASTFVGPLECVDDCTCARTAAAVILPAAASTTTPP